MNDNLYINTLKNKYFFILYYKYLFSGVYIWKLDSIWFIWDLNIKCPSFVEGIKIETRAKTILIVQDTFFCINPFFNIEVNLDRKLNNIEDLLRMEDEDLLRMEHDIDENK